MGIKEGEPWPMIAIKVGVGSESRASGVMEVLRERTNSWQFYLHSVSKYIERLGEGRHTPQKK
jgi:hypothetical protein